jgi:sugar lactone lactonase YvrE
LRGPVPSPIRGLQVSLLATALAALGASAQSLPALPLLPNGVAYDAAGNLYFADTNRHQVYESSLAGVLTVVAGSGAQGFGGDGGAAVQAQLDSPEGVAVGPDGTLYIADTRNQRIRAVAAGQITTFAGSGSTGFAGDNGPALAAAFRGPTALALDATGALLVCDTLNHRVRRISGGTITTIAGSATQGFAGDGAAATAAELDTPSGVAVGSDGRIYIADSHNDRIRVIAADGTISTFAGTGVRGFAGDNGAATAARLALPRGLIVTPAGALLFADSDNHRLRMVDANGVITTLAGSGVQGSSSDGNSSTTASLDTPRGVAVSTFGSPVFADAMNHQVREALGNGSLYLPAGLAPSRVSTASLTVSATQTGNQQSAVVTVTGAAGAPQGTAQLLDGTSLAAQTQLQSGTGSFPPVTLSAGTHQLSAAFLGDGVNPATTSNDVSVAIGQAIATASANAVTIQYGQPIPPLTGTLTGILPQDVGNVSAVFTTTAAALSPPAIYPIAAQLVGPASDDYSLVLSPQSGSLQITQAASLTAEQPLAQGSYAGLPLVLTATVSSTTQGTPTGTLTFTDAGAAITTATLVGGVATGTYLAPSAGNHSIVAAYLGDTDFAPSSSQAVATTVGPMPDFTLTASAGTSQTVTAGGSATYTLTVAAQPAPFTGAVSLSANGLPPGATVTFSPPQTIPGAGSAMVTMTIQTAATEARGTRSVPTLFLALLVCPLALMFRRRGSYRATFLATILTYAILSAMGCGARSISTAAVAHQVYTPQVTGTGTNLAGAIVTHSTTVTLMVE